MRRHRHNRRLLHAAALALLSVVSIDGVGGSGSGSFTFVAPPPRCACARAMGLRRQFKRRRKCDDAHRHILLRHPPFLRALAEREEVDTAGAASAPGKGKGINLGELTEADRKRLLRRLLVDADLLTDETSSQSPPDNESAGDHHLPFDDGYNSETLGRGFCNWVYKVTSSSEYDNTNAVVVKAFSDLAKVRVPESILGSIDVLASDADIGPRVLHRGPNGIVMEHIEGKVLTEDDVHGSDGRMLCEKIGAKLAQLHSMSLPSFLLAVDNNMLWGTLDAMLDFVENDEPIPHAVLDAGWTHARLCDEVRSMRQILDMSDLPPAVLGHGDFKPSNILVVDNDPTPSNEADTGSAVVLIDYELSGRGYRGFDFFKLFRTADPASQNQGNMEAFVCSYLQHSIGPAMGGDESSSTTIGSAQIEQVLAEMKLFEPLTWLEAGIFFLFAAKGDPTQLDRWEELALNRLDNYSASKDRFVLNLVEWESIKERKNKKTLS